MSARRYDSRRRLRSAQETRESIIRAALKLHWDGITEFAAIAEEAGCSLPTVRKHFPTKEALFQDCTRKFGESLVLPDVEALATIADTTEQLEQCVSELCRIHEAMFGYAWLGARTRSDSPALDAAMQAYEQLVDVIAEVLAPERPSVRAFLDFLSYRALRLSGELSAKDACVELIETLRPLVLTTVSAPSPRKSRKGPQL